MHRSWIWALAQVALGGGLIACDGAPASGCRVAADCEVNAVCVDGACVASVVVPVEGEGEAARILGNKERDLNGISSEAYEKVQTAKGKADAEASRIYARAYGQNPKAAELYEFIKTMEMYRSTIGEQSTLILSTDSDLFKFLKSSDADKSTPLPQRRPMVIPPAVE
jgi:hypothetical protein